MGKFARMLAAAVVALLAGVGAAAGTSRAEAPGTNGLIVYQVYVGKHAQLFTVKPDGSAVTQVTHLTDSDAVFPTWSPDGTKIAFERDFDTHAAIYTMNADGSGLRSLTPHGFNGQPGWSPDGKRIAFGRYIVGIDAGIWTMDINGKHLRRVTNNPIPKKDPCNCLGQGSTQFSPDGKRIAFVWGKGARRAAIFTITPNGSGLRRLTAWKNGVALRIDWSPDGTKIAYSSPEFDPGRPGVSSNIYTVNADGSGIAQITHEAGGTLNAGFNSWSPDGTKISFISNRSGTYEIYTMNADGTGVTQLTTGPEAHQANWGTHP